MRIEHWTHALNIISKLTIFLALIFIITIGYWLTWPYEPIKFTQEKTVLLNPNLMVKHGEPLLIEVEVDQYESGIVYSIDRRVIGENFVFALPTTSRTTEKGHFKYVNASFVIPEFIPCGHYQMKTIIKIQVNPLRTIVIERMTDQFEVYR